MRFIPQQNSQPTVPGTLTIPPGGEQGYAVQVGPVAGRQAIVHCAVSTTAGAAFRLDWLDYLALGEVLTADQDESGAWVITLAIRDMLKLKDIEHIAVRWSSPPGTGPSRK